MRFRISAGVARIAATVGLLSLGCWLPIVRGEEPVSGPKVNESLPKLVAIQGAGDDAGKPVDVLSTVKDKPVLLVFVSQRTRPGFGLLKLLDKYGQLRQPDGLQTVIVYLDEDADAAVKYCKLMRGNYGFQATLLTGQEGKAPPDYVLHDDAELTILLTDKNHKVIHNTARRAAEAQDFPAIREAIDKLLGPSPVKFDPGDRPVRGK